MIDVLRSGVFYLGYFAGVLASGIFLLPIAPFLPLARRYGLLNLYNHFLIRWFQLACGVRYDIQGRENLPNGPCVIQANHQCEWETVFLQVMMPPVCTVLKRELLRIPIFGWGLRLLRPISLDRSRPSRALKQVLSQGVERLNSGLSVLIFPEGTRVDPGVYKRYNKSGTIIACRAGVPVLPVAHNAGERWPGRHWVKRPGVLRVRIGAPITTVGKTPDTVIAEVEEWVEGQLREISDVPRPERPAAAKKAH
ncbi:lysophospholipid acyltransferase family protein [Vreelandella subglaciescola]|uniref:1-acyl-sn-glycerol-3-phosphate acyltransferase n=1 Tax=Vreelandella subglaciescola TaxID=29571 RepID=A0A1M7GQA6_9GAMM|nr:lysophospholipid acyltransferase family protein [Halomonas subglaciescola]SHM18544.1 1-acyl-sn-glycerol-3-phosphate acyltransferase [Halomonas subglaciescola]